MKTSLLPPLLALSLCCSLAQAAPAEHQEFEATLLAPFQAGAAQGRTFTLQFAYPGLARRDTVDWWVELVRPDGRVALRWRGAAPFTGDEMTVAVPWSGRLGLSPAPSGIYRVRLRATVRGDAHEEIEQDWEIAVGAPLLPAMPAFSPLPRAFEPAAVAAPG